MKGFPFGFIFTWVPDLFLNFKTYHSEEHPKKKWNLCFKWFVTIRWSTRIILTTNFEKLWELQHGMKWKQYHNFF